MSVKEYNHKNLEIFGKVQNLFDEKNGLWVKDDAIYPVMRNLVNENLGRFPLKEVIEYYKGKRKSINFTQDDIDNILNYDYGSARTYCALTLLYPALNYSFKDQDQKLGTRQKVWII